MLKHTLAGLVFILSCGGDAASPPQAPSAPINTVTNSRTEGINLAWLDASNETHYLVEYHPETQNAWFPLEQLPANTTSYLHSNVLRKLQYFYRVAACNASGCSDWAATSGRWTVPNGLPALLTSDVIQIGGYAATLSATARSGGVPVSFLFTVTKAGETVPFYTETVVEAPPLDAEGDVQVTGSKRYNLLQPGTDYVMNVVVTNQYGAGGTGTPKAFRTRTPTPPIVERLSVGGTGTATPIFIAWILPNGFDTDYVFEMVRAGDSFANPVATQHGHTLGTNSEAFGRTGIPAVAQPGVTYHWRVVAINEGGTTISPTQTWVAQ